MSVKIKSVCCSQDLKKTISISSLENGADRVIKKYPLPYSYNCSPNQERNFSEKVLDTCRYINQTRNEMLRLTKVIVVGDVAVGKTCLVRRPGPTSTSSVADLRRMAELWAKRSQENSASVTTPRTPVNHGSPSPMIESTPADATPLIDEY